MALRHIVFFRLPDRDPDKILEARRLLLSLEKLPMIQSLEVGVDIDRSERAWDLALVTTFADEAALAAYQADPDHQEVVKWLRAQPTTTSVVDFHV